MKGKRIKNNHKKPLSKDFETKHLYSYALGVELLKTFTAVGSCFMTSAQVKECHKADNHRRFATICSYGCLQNIHTSLISQHSPVISVSVNELVGKEFTTPSTNERSTRYNGGNDTVSADACDALSSGPYTSVAVSYMPLRR